MDSMASSAVAPGERGPASGWWGGSVAAQDGMLLLGLALLVTLLGVQIISRSRQQPINNSVTGLVIGMLTGAIVFSDAWWYLFGYMSHQAITLNNEVFYNVLLPPIVFYAGFSVKKKLFFKNLVTIAIFGILGCNLTAAVLSGCLYPVLRQLGIGTDGGSAPSILMPPPSLPLHAAAESLVPAAAALNPGVAGSSASTRKRALPSEARHLLMDSMALEAHSLHASDLASYPAGLSVHEEARSEDVGDASAPYPARSRASRGFAADVDAEAEGAGSIGASRNRRPASIMNATTLQQSVRLGTVFSSTDHFVVLHSIDPIQQPVLHSLLFGEDVMNHITSIVMLHTFADLPEVSAAAILPRASAFLGCLLGSLAAGVGAGLLSAIFIKHLFSQGHHHTDREVLVMSVMAVVAFVGALRMNLSGIISLFFCGITMSHYTWHTISQTARVMSVHNFRVVASVSETFMFIYAGLDVSGKITARMTDFQDYENKDFVLTAFKLAVALLGLMASTRAVFVAVAVAVVNLWRRYKFTAREAFVLWYSGLVRGSITTCLVYAYFNVPGMSRSHGSERHDDLEVVLVAAVLVIVVSTVLLGGLSGAVMRRAALPPAESRLEEIRMLPTMNGNDDGASMNSAAVLSSKLHRIWRKFDRRIMKHFFGGRDSSAPNYLQSVSELNRTMARGTAERDALPMSSMLPPLVLTTNSPLAGSQRDSAPTRSAPDLQSLECTDLCLSPQSPSTDKSIHLDDFAESAERVPSLPAAVRVLTPRGSDTTLRASTSGNSAKSMAIANGRSEPDASCTATVLHSGSQPDLEGLAGTMPGSPAPFLGVRKQGSPLSGSALLPADIRVTTDRRTAAWRHTLQGNELGARDSDGSRRSSVDEYHDVHKSIKGAPGAPPGADVMTDGSSANTTPAPPGTPPRRVLRRGHTFSSATTDSPASRQAHVDPALARGDVGALDLSVNRMLYPLDPAAPPQGTLRQPATLARLTGVQPLSPRRPTSTPAAPETPLPQPTMPPGPSPPGTPSAAASPPSPAVPSLYAGKPFSSMPLNQLGSMGGSAFSDGSAHADASRTSQLAPRRIAPHLPSPAPSAMPAPLAQMPSPGGPDSHQRPPTVRGNRPPPAPGGPSAVGRGAWRPGPAAGGQPAVPPARPPQHTGPSPHDVFAAAAPVSAAPVVRADSTGIASFLSGAEDNLPAPYQPADSFAGSEDEDENASPGGSAQSPDDAVLNAAAASFADAAAGQQ